MSNEQAKETIKLQTEFLKFYFILFVGIATGSLALLVKPSVTPFDIGFGAAGIGSDAVILLLIERMSRRIRKNIQMLT